MKWYRLTLVLSALALAGAVPAQAQVRLTTAGGVSYPLGELSEFFDRGWNAQASASVGVPVVPVGLRIDAAYNRFENGDGNFQTIAGSVNGILNIPAVLVTPYLIGGVGVYNMRVSDIALDDVVLDETTNMGINVGAGLRLTLPVVALFAEARLHSIFTEGTPIRYVPLTVGLQF